MCTVLACAFSSDVQHSLAVNTAKSYCDLLDSFSDLREPFNLQQGWILWAGIGLVGALVAIALTGLAASFFSGETPQREVRFQLALRLSFADIILHEYTVVGDINFPWNQHGF